MATPWVVVSDFLLLLAIAGKLGSECYALTSFMAFTETSVTSVRRDLRYLETRPGLLPQADAVRLPVARDAGGFKKGTQ
jgi:hypothetical protein